MSNVEDKIEYFSIRDVLDAKNGHYIIPIYQRNYSWGKIEIEQLIDDICNAATTQYEKNYYIGSLVVYRRKNGNYEVIDGQQRLTTLTILHSVLRRNFGLSSEFPNLGGNLSFEHRDQSRKQLDKLFSNEIDIDKVDKISEAYHIINDKLSSSKELDWNKFKNFLFNKVQILRTEVLPNTDLNHYFEIMNSRGEQLEKHEVLKAQFMSEFQIEEERKLFSIIWDACSDMDRSIVMGFDMPLRKELFFSSSDDKQEEFNYSMDFTSLMTSFKNVYKEKSDRDANFQNLGNDGADSTSTGERTNQLLDILSKQQDYLNSEKDKDDKDVNTRSIIDFSNFLMQSLRLYKKDTSISLDDKKIIKYFNDNIKGLYEIKDFIVFLLKVRICFDKHIIKYTQSSYDDWSLMMPKIGKRNNSNYIYYVNTFDDQEKQNEIVLLLSMFQTIYTQRNNKNWLHDILCWFRDEDWKLDSESSYIKELQNLAEKYADAKNDNLDVGTGVKHFIFNYLDYLIYKKFKTEGLNDSLPCDGKRIEDNRLGKYFDNFKFSYRSSIEHCYPQNLNKEHYLGKWADNVEIIDTFGNLCLIEPEFNSSLSDNSINLKRAKLIELLEKNDKRSASLKQVIMLMYNDDCWKSENAKETIREHREKMFKFLGKEH